MDQTPPQNLKKTIEHLNLTTPKIGKTNIDEILKKQETKTTETRECPLRLNPITTGNTDNLLRLSEITFSTKDGIKQDKYTGAILIKEEAKKHIEETGAQIRLKTACSYPPDLIDLKKSIIGPKESDLTSKIGEGIIAVSQSQLEEIINESPAGPVIISYNKEKGLHIDSGLLNIKERRQYTHGREKQLKEIIGEKYNPNIDAPTELLTSERISLLLQIYALEYRNLSKNPASYKQLIKEYLFAPELFNEGVEKAKKIIPEQQKRIDELVEDIKEKSVKAVEIAKEKNVAFNWAFLHFKKEELLPQKNPKNLKEKALQAIKKIKEKTSHKEAITPITEKKKTLTDFIGEKIYRHLKEENSEVVFAIEDTLKNNENLRKFNIVAEKLGKEKIREAILADPASFEKSLQSIVEAPQEAVTEIAEIISNNNSEAIAAFLQIGAAAKRYQKDETVIELLHKMSSGNLNLETEYNQSFEKITLFNNGAPTEITPTTKEETLREARKLMEKFISDKGEYKTSIRDDKTSTDILDEEEKKKLTEEIENLRRKTTSIQEQVNAEKKIIQEALTKNFLKKYGNHIYQENIEVYEARNILHKLRDFYIKEGEAAKKLSQAIASMDALDAVSGTVTAKVWRRTIPDMGYEKETGCCTNPGGNKENAIFEYLLNPSILILDFFKKNKRFIRCECMITYDNQNGKVLLVDSVEARNRIQQPNAVKQIIEDFAKTSGCDSVAYYTKPVNPTPKKFLEDAFKEKKPEEITLKTKNPKGTEYFDSFNNKRREEIKIPAYIVDLKTTKEETRKHEDTKKEDLTLQINNRRRNQLWGFRHTWEDYVTPEKLAEELLKGLDTENKKILLIPSGAGGLAGALSEKAPKAKIIAADISNYSLMAAAIRASEKNQSTIREKISVDERTSRHKIKETYREYLHRIPANLFLIEADICNPPIKDLDLIILHDAEVISSIYHEHLIALNLILATRIGGTIKQTLVWHYEEKEPPFESEIFEKSRIFDLYLENVTEKLIPTSGYTRQSRFKPIISGTVTKESHRKAKRDLEVIRLLLADKTIEEIKQSLNLTEEELRESLSNLASFRTSTEAREEGKQLKQKIEDILQKIKNKISLKDNETAMLFPPDNSSQVEDELHPQQQRKQTIDDIEAGRKNKLPEEPENKSTEEEQQNKKSKATETSRGYATTEKKPALKQIETDTEYQKLKDVIKKNPKELKSENIAELIWTAINEGPYKEKALKLLGRIYSSDTRWGEAILSSVIGERLICQIHAEKISGKIEDLLDTIRGQALYDEEDWLINERKIGEYLKPFRNHPLYDKIKKALASIGYIQEEGIHLNKYYQFLEGHQWVSAEGTINLEEVEKILEDTKRAYSIIAVATIGPENTKALIEKKLITKQGGLTLKEERSIKQKDRLYKNISTPHEFFALYLAPEIAAMQKEVVEILAENRVFHWMVGERNRIHDFVITLAHSFTKFENRHLELLKVMCYTTEDLSVKNAIHRIFEIESESRRTEYTNEDMAMMGGQRITQEKEYYDRPEYDTAYRLGNTEFLDALTEWLEEKRKTGKQNIRREADELSKLLGDSSRQLTLYLEKIKPPDMTKEELILLKAKDRRIRDFADLMGRDVFYFSDAIEIADELLKDKKAGVWGFRPIIIKYAINAFRKGPNDDEKNLPEKDRKERMAARIKSELMERHRKTANLDKRIPSIGIEVEYPKGRTLHKQTVIRKLINQLGLKRDPDFSVALEIVPGAARNLWGQDILNDILEEYLFPEGMYSYHITLGLPEKLSAYLKTVFGGPDNPCYVVNEGNTEENTYRIIDEKTGKVVGYVRMIGDSNIWILEDAKKQYICLTYPEEIGVEGIEKEARYVFYDITELVNFGLLITNALMVLHTSDERLDMYAEIKELIRLELEPGNCFRFETRPFNFVKKKDLRGIYSEDVQHRTIRDLLSLGVLLNSIAYERIEPNESKNEQLKKLRQEFTEEITSIFREAGMEKFLGRVEIRQDHVRELKEKRHLIQKKIYYALKKTKRNLAKIDPEYARQAFEEETEVLAPATTETESIIGHLPAFEIDELDRLISMVYSGEITNLRTYRDVGGMLAGESIAERLVQTLAIPNTEDRRVQKALRLLSALRNPEPQPSKTWLREEGFTQATSEQKRTRDGLENEALIRSIIERFREMKYTETASTAFDRIENINSEKYLPEEAYVFVYGTLKKGERNHSRLRDSEFIGEAEIKGTMYLMGDAPIISLDGDSTIKGEVYRVKKKVIMALDAEEGYPVLYNRGRIKLPNGEEALVYYGENIEKENLPIIKSGYWSERKTSYATSGGGNTQTLFKPDILEQSYVHSKTYKRKGFFQSDGRPDFFYSIDFCVLDKPKRNYEEYIKPALEDMKPEIRAVVVEAGGKLLEEISKSWDASRDFRYYSNGFAELRSEDTGLALWLIKNGVADILVEEGGRMNDSFKELCKLLSNVAEINPEGKLTLKKEYAENEKLLTLMQKNRENISAEELLDIVRERKVSKTRNPLKTMSPHDNTPNLGDNSLKEARRELQSSKQRRGVDNEEAILYFPPIFFSSILPSRRNFDEKTFAQTVHSKYLALERSGLLEYYLDELNRLPKADAEKLILEDRGNEIKFGLGVSGRGIITLNNLSNEKNTDSVKKIVSKNRGGAFIYYLGEGASIRQAIKDNKKDLEKSKAPVFILVERGSGVFAFEELSTLDINAPTIIVPTNKGEPNLGWNNFGRLLREQLGIEYVFVEGIEGPYSILRATTYQEKLNRELNNLGFNSYIGKEIKGREKTDPLRQRYESMKQPSFETLSRFFIDNWLNGVGFDYSVLSLSEIEEGLRKSFNEVRRIYESAEEATTFCRICGGVMSDLKEKLREKREIESRRLIREAGFSMIVTSLPTYPSDVLEYFVAYVMPSVLYLSNKEDVNSNLEDAKNRVFEFESFERDIFSIRKVSPKERCAPLLLKNAIPELAKTSNSYEEFSSKLREATKLLKKLILDRDYESSQWLAREGLTNFDSVGGVTRFRNTLREELTAALRNAEERCDEESKEIYSELLREDALERLSIGLLRAHIESKGIGIPKINEKYLPARLRGRNLSSQLANLKFGGLPFRKTFISAVNLIDNILSKPKTDETKKDYGRTVDYNTPSLNIKDEAAAGNLIYLNMEKRRYMKAGSDELWLLDYSHKPPAEEVAAGLLLGRLGGKPLINTKILLYPCGPGALAGELARRAGKVFALDISRYSRMLAALKSVGIQPEKELANEYARGGDDAIRKKIEDLYRLHTRNILRNLVLVEGDFYSLPPEVRDVDLTIIDDIGVVASGPQYLYAFEPIIATRVGGVIKEMPFSNGKPLKIFDLYLDEVHEYEIEFKNTCFPSRKVVAGVVTEESKKKTLLDMNVLNLLLGGKSKTKIMDLLGISETEYSESISRLNLLGLGEEKQ